MEYGMLLYPHANARYQQAIKPLAQAELLLMMNGAHIAGETQYKTIAGLDWLLLSTQPLTAAQVEILREHSHLYLLVEFREGGLFQPLNGRRVPYLGADLPGILKYKGKTNESFTHMLNNFAYYSSDFSQKADQPIQYLDPLCGRATALFDAVNRRWSATGIDMDQSDISEAYAFFKRYLEYHKFKHSAKDDALTSTGKKSILRRQFVFADTPEHFRAGETVSLSLIKGDTVDTARALGKKARYHVITADLPYGVQHAPGARGKMSAFDEMMTRSLSVWYEKLMPGGAIALSFNANTIRAQWLREQMEKAGFSVCEGGCYEGLSHWVEQAVTRDLVVGRKNC